MVYFLAGEYAPGLNETLEREADDVARAVQYWKNDPEKGIDEGYRAIPVFIAFLLWHFVFAALILHWRKK